MSSYQKTSWDILVTHYREKRDQPPLADSGTLEEADSHIPPRLSFVLANNTKLVVDTDREIVIGRRSRQSDPIVNVDLNHYQGHEMGVSRFHAMIAVIKGRLSLQDLNSINGTLLNGKRTIPMKRYPLQHGDEISVSSLVMRVEFIWD